MVKSTAAAGLAGHAAGSSAISAFGPPAGFWIRFVAYFIDGLLVLMRGDPWHHWLSCFGDRGHLGRSEENVALS